jgi:hypothetical protein
MAIPAKAYLDDARKFIQIFDISRGLNTRTGALSLGSNQVPDCLNIFSYQGVTLFRGGYFLFCPLGYPADAAFEYTDGDQNPHYMVWAGGNLYDCISGTAVTIATAVYTAGSQIGYTILNSTLLWSTLGPPPVPLRMWTGTGAEGPVVSNLVPAGSVPAPAASVLLTYAGSVVAVAPNYSGFPQPSGFGWSDVNDFTTWIGANLQTAGSNDGSVCTFGVLMGEAEVGVPATRQLLIGKNQKNMFMYQGALGTLTENVISCPQGSRDVNSAQYIPSDEGLGTVMFLANDNQFWITNGVTARRISGDILDTLQATITNNLLVNPNQKFFSAYHKRRQYYVCDLGQNQQLCFRWDTKAWWPFEGWPSGPFLTAQDIYGLPTVFMAGSRSSSEGLYQVAVDQTLDNGGPITAYFTTPWLHAGDPMRGKIFQSYYLHRNNVGIQYKITGQSMLRANNTTVPIQPIYLQDSAPVPGAGGNTLVWDQGKWDQNTWGGTTGNTNQPYLPITNGSRINYVTAGTPWVKAGTVGKLRSNAIQLTIAYNMGVADFQVIGQGIGYIEKGRKYVGNQPGTSQGNVPTSPSPYATASNSS